jgi:hypothetical protein
MLLYLKIKITALSYFKCLANEFEIYPPIPAVILLRSKFYGMSSETEKEITERIIAITLEIQENYPELARYVIEMTDANPDEKNPDVNQRKLKEYYNSLLEMVKKYKQYHLKQQHESTKM